jgi:hypothetical protein
VQEESYDGIGAHRDEPKFINVLCLVILQDGGQFYFVPDSKERIVLRAGAGSVIVMAGKEFNEKDMRPKHGVQSIYTPRKTLGLRQV